MDRTFTEKPLDCKWSGWAKWSDCSQSCGKGSQTRERSIEMLARNGGSPCRGKGKQKRSCQIASCPSKLLSQIQKLSKYFTAPMRTIQQVRPVKYMLSCTKRTTCHTRKQVKQNAIKIWYFQSQFLCSLQWLSVLLTF